MKIAVIHNGGSVGCWRWLKWAFAPIKKHFKDTEICVFCNKNFTCPNEILEDLTNLGLIMYPLCFSNTDKIFRCKNKFKSKIINDKYNKFRKWLFDKKYNTDYLKQLQKVNECDIAFYTWPYDMSPFELNIPSCFIPHDFIFTHFFGLHFGNVYNKEFFFSIKALIKKYLENGSVPCVSSQYIADEFKRTFPDYNGEINVIHLAPQDKDSNINDNAIQEVLKKFDLLNKNFIFYPTNDMLHKNMEAVLAAYYYVKQQYPDIKLIIIGYGTDGIRAKMNSPFYADHVMENDDYDIKSLGLVSESELVALMKSAKLLVNASLCEAACGSGADAWELGCPTAISAIPPYIEQVDFLGVKTEFFNPKNSEDIAKAMLRLLDNPEIAQRNAQISQNAVKSYNDFNVAEKYLKVFQEVIERNKNEQKVS